MKKTKLTEIDKLIKKLNMKEKKLKELILQNQLRFFSLKPESSGQDLGNFSDNDGEVFTRIMNNKTITAADRTRISGWFKIAANAKY